MSAEGLSLYVVRFEASPTEGAELDASEIEQAGGAFVVCYVMAEGFFSAIEAAVAAIAAAGWRVDEPDYAERHDADTLLANPDTAPYVEEAMREGASLVFHVYPEEEEEEP